MRDSKKLLTVRLSCGLLSCNYIQDAEHDALIAHEQREVMGKLVVQLRTMRNWIEQHETNPAANHLISCAFEAETAAAPYLED